MTSLSVILVLCVTIIHIATSHPAHTELKDNDSNLDIIGGHIMPIKDAPFMAVLFKVHRNKTIYKCAASIIHEQFVLTTAYCCEGLTKAIIRVGSRTLSTGGQLYDLKKKFTHYMYDHETHNYDACVIQLNDTLTFGPKIAKITLADDNVKLDVGTRLSALGWGDTRDDGKEDHVEDSKLREVILPLVSDLRCKKLYETFTDSMICAGNKNKNTCHGDIGGPLTLLNAIQVGITSFGSGCHRAGGYTKIEAVLRWIEMVIQWNE